MIVPQRFALSGTTVYDSSRWDSRVQDLLIPGYCATHGPFASKSALKMEQISISNGSASGTKKENPKSVGFAVFSCSYPGHRAARRKD